MNSIKELHPSSLILYYVILVAMLVITLDPLLIIMTLAIGSVVFLQYASLKKYRDELFFSGFTACILVVAIIFFYHNGKSALFYLNDQAVTSEVVSFAFIMAIFVICLWMIIQLIITTISSNAIIYLFTKTMPSIGIALAMLLRYIPEVKERYNAVLDSQRAIGYLSSSSFFERSYLKCKIALESLFWAFEKSLRKSTMMQIRGYKSGKRSSYKRYRWSIVDAIVCIFSVTAVLIITFYRNEVSFFYFPEMKAIQVGWHQKLLLFFILLLAMIEMKGWIQWAYYKSKM